MSAILRELRSAMLALPSRLQSRLGHLTAHDLTVIDREVRDLLSQMGGTPAGPGRDGRDEEGAYHGNR